MQIRGQFCAVPDLQQVLLSALVLLLFAIWFVKRKTHEKNLKAGVWQTVALGPNLTCCLFVGSSVETAMPVYVMSMVISPR